MEQSKYKATFDKVDELVEKINFDPNKIKLDDRMFEKFNKKPKTQEQKEREYRKYHKKPKMLNNRRTIE